MNDSIVDRRKLLDALAALAVPNGHLASALRLIPERAIGVLVYGSRARHDFTDDSDLDLLLVLPEARGSRVDGAVTMSCYTPAQLASASGTLFGMHLQRDGRILHDTQGVLGALLASLTTPDPAMLLSRVRHLSAPLDVSEPDLGAYLSGLCKVARYLLRTAIYALALRGGAPCFSVRELAERFSDPDLARILSSDPAIVGPPSPAAFTDLVTRLSRIIGATPGNPHKSLHALIVNEWDSDRERAALAILATASPDGQFDYAQLPKVLL